MIFGSAYWIESDVFLGENIDFSCLQKPVIYAASITCRNGNEQRSFVGETMNNLNMSRIDRALMGLFNSQKFDENKATEKVISRNVFCTCEYPH